MADHPSTLATLEPRPPLRVCPILPGASSWAFAPACEGRFGSNSRRAGGTSDLPAPPFRLRNRGRDVLDQVHERQARRLVLDGCERMSKAERPRVGNQREHRLRPVAATGAFEQRGNRNPKDGGNFDEASRCDAIAGSL